MLRHNVLSPLCIGVLLAHTAAAVTIPDLPEPLKSNYEAGVAPSIRSSLEARIVTERSTALWISPTGNPGAAGTEADPMNLAEGSAYANANKGISVLFHPGTYDARGFSTLIDYSSGISSASDFIIAAPDGMATFNAGHTVTTAEMTDQGDGTWTFSFDPALSDTPGDNRLVLIPAGADGRNYFKRKSSTAEVAAEDKTYSFNVSGQTVRVNFDGSPTDVVISCAQRFASFDNVPATIGMYGLTLNHFRTGGPSFSANTLSAYDVHVNYAWDFSNRTDGWSFGANANVTLEQCSGNYVQNDGFNSKGDNVYTRLINCQAIGNNDDGYSPHRDSELWEVWGGLYQNNGKGNLTPAGGRGFAIGAILDTNLGRAGYEAYKGGSFRGLSLNAQTTQVTWMKDCTITNGGSGSKAVNNKNAISYVRLDNCRIEGSETGLHSEGGKILAINPRFSGNSLDYDINNSNIEVIYTVEAYLVPPGETVSSRFTVEVDGITVPVIEESRTYAHFSFSGTVTVTVTASTPGDLTGWKVSPVDYGIPFTNDGTTLSFELDRPRYLAIHQNYESDLVPLFIFADPIEHNPPKPTDINVLDYGSYPGTINEAVTAVSLDPTLDIVYVPPGTYDSGQIDMKSDTQLYLAGGALIRFTGSDYDTPLEYDWIRKGDQWGGLEFLGVDNAKVFGRGTFDALNNGSFNNCVYANQATNITISGIITRYSNDWNWLITESDGVDITYIKVINDH